MDKCEELFKQANPEYCRTDERWMGWQMAWSYLNADLLKAQREVEELKSTTELASQPQVPEGWKLVPIEPTHEMLAAAFDIHEFPPFQGEEDEQSESIYKAMLAAAPKGVKP